MNQASLRETAFHGAWRACLSRWAGRAALALLSAVWLWGSTATAGFDFSCPPKDADTRPCVDVPGMPGEQGWLIGTNQDDAGNLFEVWCLKKGNGHDGPDGAGLWRPLTGPPVWVGACVFPGGLNKLNERHADETGGPTGQPNGRPDSFSVVTWHNIENFVDSATNRPASGTNDWDYSFDTATGKLTIGKSLGTWTNRGAGLEWVRTGLVFETNDAPREFKGLKFGTNQITASLGANGRISRAFGAALTNSSNGRWEYALRANTFGPTADDTNSYSTFTALVATTDKFTIGAADIQSPFVTGPAALPEFGAWIVSRFDNTFVTYQPSLATELPPGADLSGFGFYSRGSAGEVSWNFASQDEELCSSDTMTGPILKLAYLRSGQYLVLTWSVPQAKLQYSQSLADPWVELPLAATGFNVQMTNQMTFFRLSLPP